MTDRAAALPLLRRAIAVPDASFREGQWEAIDALVNRQERLLAVQRTGWGKSTVYFIATKLLRDAGRGPTLIVSPLLALMRNQIEAAGRLGIEAIRIDSTNRDLWPELTRSVREGQADVLLISPERLANEDFARDVLLPISTRLGLLVIRETERAVGASHTGRDAAHRCVREGRSDDDGPPFRRRVGGVRALVGR